MALDQFPADIQEEAAKTANYNFSHVDLSKPLAESMYTISVNRYARMLEDGQDIQINFSGKETALKNKSSATTAQLTVRDINLPALPQVGVQLQNVLNDPKSSAHDLAKIISMDPKLTATLLRMVNSAVYGFRQPVETVTRAVAVIGTRQISTIALGTLMLNLFKKPQAVTFDMQKFWQHSIACGVIARALAARSGQSDPERFFVGGLLHDIGRLALVVEEPEVFSQIMYYGYQNRETLHNSEKKILGFDHATLGGMLMRRWKLPLSLVSSVIYHHTPELSKNHIDPHIVHLAENMAKSMGYFSENDFYINPPNEESWTKLHLSLVELDEILNGCEAKIEAMTEALS